MVGGYKIVTTCILSLRVLESNGGEPLLRTDTAPNLPKLCFNLVYPFPPHANDSVFSLSGADFENTGAIAEIKFLRKLLSQLETAA